MTQSSNILSAVITATIFGVISLTAIPVLANSGIRIHKANQFQSLTKKYDENHQTKKQFRFKRRARHSSSAHKQEQTVPDSRFPNTYRDRSYYQKQQSQKNDHRNH